MAQPQRLKRLERDAGDERSGIVGRDQRLAALDARGGIAARRRPDPVGEIVSGERDVARLAGRAAGREDADEIGHVGRQMGADGIVGGPRLAEFVLFREGQRRNFGEAADRGGVGKARRGQPCTVEGRTGEEIGDLFAVRPVVGAGLLDPRHRFDARIEHQRPALPPS
jgi:hypothetical protein